MTIKAQNHVPFTLEDRDRIIRLEEKAESLEKGTGSLRNEMNTRFESIEARFIFFYWVLSILIALVVLNLGYTIWDRRTAIYPIREKLRDIEKDQDETNKKMVEVDKIKTASKEMGESDQKIAEILKRTVIF